MDAEEVDRLRGVVKQAINDEQRREEERKKVAELRKEFPWCQRDNDFVSNTKCKYLCVTCTYFWYPNESREAHLKRVSDIMWNKEMMKKRLGGGSGEKNEW